MLVSTSSQQQIQEKLNRVRNQTEYICAPLKPEDTVVQPVVDVSPPKWHLGHTTWFFEAFVLEPNLPGYQVFHPKYAYLFNSYYEGAGERVERAYRGNMTRPSLGEILEYRKHVTQHLNEYLSGPYTKTDEIYRVIELGMQHEQQHQELLLYDIKYILGHNPLFPVYREKASTNGQSNAAVGEAKFLKVDAGIYEVGYEGPGFHFDNEECVHKVYVEDFEIMDRLITHGEFLEFVEAGGYKDYRYWLMEGWAWVNEHKKDMPFYWFKVDGKWKHVTLHGLQDIDWDLPMTHISYYEANAFANWKSMRLPTEFQWEIACNTFSPEIPEAANFVESEHYGPAKRKAGNYQFYGDAWEWTQSAYLPYPRYKAPEGTLGEYNGKFMVNQMVLKGGSCATPRDHIRPSYRNFFHPHLQWLFNGFRLVK